MRYKKLGLIDSGKGGQLVAKRIKEKSPEVETFQYIPPAFVSFSNTSIENLFIQAYTHVEYLKEQEVDLIVVGCMTLSTNCLNFIKMISNVKVLDVYSNLGYLDDSWTVIATNNSINSGKFKGCVEIPCGHLSGAIQNKEALIDSGMTYSDCNAELSYKNLIKGLLRGFINCSDESPTKKLILGCTHYPLEIDLIKEVFGQDIEILDPITKLLEVL